MDKQKKITVLVVDDDPVNTRIMERGLHREGYQVIIAPDGISGRKVAFDEHPDLIILDIMMPGEDGFSVIKSLKEHKGTRNIPVLFVSGKIDIKYKVRGFEFGAVDYITKPFYIQEVVARVKLHLKLNIATEALLKGQAEKVRQLKEAHSELLITPVELPKAKFGVQYISILEEGGDFYDVLPISENIFGYFVGDVSGHDIKTNFISASLKALLKQNCLPVYSPIETMQMLNSVLMETLPKPKFLTSCYCRLNRSSKVLTIVSAGHPPAIFVPKEGNAKFVDIKGDVQGVFENATFEVEEIATQEGDRFYIYTDGLFERGSVQASWSRNRQDILDACSSLKNESVEEAVKKLPSLVQGKNHSSQDDTIILCVEV